MSNAPKFRGAEDLLEAGYAQADWFFDVIRNAKRQRFNRDQALSMAARFHEQSKSTDAVVGTSAFSARDLVLAGFTPAPWFDSYVDEVGRRGMPTEQALRHAPVWRKAWEDSLPREIPLQDSLPFVLNLTADDATEARNAERVVDSFRELMKTPVLIAGAVMPDACLAGIRGEITVGGVVAAKGAIMPGAHSADVCCSVFVTVLDTPDADRVMEAAAGIVHFGPGGRHDGRFDLPEDLARRFSLNPFMDDPRNYVVGKTNLGTFGDGNHFCYVGRMADDRVAVVSHHGSRGIGAMLYKKGMRVAEGYREKLSPDTLKMNAWIPIDSREGEHYWEALQLTRAWTKESHRVTHDAIAADLGLRIDRQLWNEHNFVFREDDVFWHAKGATPIHNAFLPDTDGIQIVPLNMAQPVLLVSGERNERNLGFAPHGAGRNLARYQHRALMGDRPLIDIFREETAGLDVRFHSNRIDISELPSAYKNAAAVRRDMERFGLCRVVEEIRPYGSIMAGDYEGIAPWKRPDPGTAPEADRDDASPRP